MIWRFHSKDETAFQYTIKRPNQPIVRVKIYGAIHRKKMQPTYSYNDFLSTFICDEFIKIGEVNAE